MDDTVAMFVVIMTALVATAGIILAWIKHRAPATIAAGTIEANRQVELLSSENGALKGQLSRLEERIAVLERIATDPAERTARAIEQLR